MKAIIKLFSLGIAISFIGCSPAKSIDFETPVDTRSRPIKFQVKKTFEIEALGVFASNDFDGARLNSFEKINDSTVQVTVEPENAPINNSPYYAFKTWSNNSKSIYYTFKYPKGFKHRYIPKLKVNNKWSAIDSSQIYKNDSIVTIKLSLSSNPIFVAGQKIQSSSDVKNWYSNLVSTNSKIVANESAGKTTLGRNLPVLDIGIGEKKNKPIIVLLTRQHPPEVTGYFAFQEFLETILNKSELSTIFLEQYRILAFPIMNPDGVDLGHWRHNAGGVDTNRDWSKYHQPEIRQVVKFISKEIKRNRSKLLLGIDFHSTYYDVFYTNKIREGTASPNFISNWFTGLENDIPNYKVNEASSNSTRPVSKGWFLYGHNAVGITYEIGDATPKKNIEEIGRVSAEQMMKILTIK